jgi:2-polyprenyl-3-methyl-5-hydroxy-6-metoxy-1,4-benzoquinol methylase
LSSDHYSVYNDAKYYQSKFFEENTRFVFLFKLLKQLEKEGSQMRGSALSVGCGTGFELLFLKQMGYKVVGMDISEYAVNIARKRVPSDVKVFVHNIEETNARASDLHEQFNLITCFEVLEHLRKPDKAVKNMYMLLNKGDYLIASTPNAESLLHKAGGKSLYHINEKNSEEWRNFFLGIDEDWNYLRIVQFGYLLLLSKLFRVRTVFFRFPFLG